MWQLARGKHNPANKDYNYRSSKMRNCFGSIMGKIKIIRRQIREDNERKTVVTFSSINLIMFAFMSQRLRTSKQAEFQAHIANKRRR